MQDVFKDREDEKFDEATLVGQIKCQIRQGVALALYRWQTNGGRYEGLSVEWLRKWAAKVTLKITVDEKSNVNPGVTLSRPFENAVSFFRTNGNVTTSQSFAGSVGLQASSDATRVETIGFTYVIDDLLKQPPPDNNQRCTLISGAFIDSDLKIDEFIVNKTYIAHVPELVDGKPNAGPFTVFSDQVTFVVIYGANATPVWKLVHITANNNSPLVNAMRTRTHDLTITLAPPDPNSIPGRPPALSPDGEAVNIAQLIGQATASAIQSRAP